MTDILQKPDWEGFGRAIMEEWDAYYDIEASEKFDLARKFNILREIPGGFDPESHSAEYCDAEEGDPWFELNDAKSAPDTAAPVSPQEAAKVLLNTQAYTETVATYAAAREYPSMGFINAAAVVGAALRALAEQEQTDG